MEEKRFLKKNDMILIAVLLLVGVACYILFGLGKVDGALVLVRVDGNIAMEYPLHEDRLVALDYNGHNQLVIENGIARIADADCPDKLCVKQRSISKNGETIVCLPHHVIVEVSGGAAREIDGVTQ